MQSRRRFLEEVSFASLFAGYPLATRESLTRLVEHPPQTQLPKALKRGDTVALVAPASPFFDPESHAIAREMVTSLGYKPKPMPNSARVAYYLAGSDAERAADLNAAFADPEVDAIWCLRGGYGSPRILPLLDYESIRKNPKILLGYSDITAVLNAVHRLTGLVTFHGPVASENMAESTLAALKKVAGEARPAGLIAAPPSFEAKEGRVERENRTFRVAPGRARGPLVGGNLSVFDTLIGTPFEPELKGRILFLEEVGEEPYRIDRWLTHLVLTGKLAGCAGIVLGKFHDCGPRVLEPSFNGTWTWQHVVADRLAGQGIPVLGGLMFGHGSQNSTLPIGVEAELDADKATLTLLGPAVR